MWHGMIRAISNVVMLQATFEKKIIFNSSKKKKWKKKTKFSIQKKKKNKKKKLKKPEYCLKDAREKP